MAQESTYIHGTHPEEQRRLSLLNDLTNASFIDFLEIMRGQLVLEVGSGLRILANGVATRVPSSAVTGVEIAPEQIEKARANFSNTLNLRFLLGDALSLGFKEPTFDVVYCRYVLEHVPDPATALREIFRVLKSGGKLFLQENNILVYAVYPDCPSYMYGGAEEVRRASITGGWRCRSRQETLQPSETEGFASISLSIGPEVQHYDLPTFDPWIVNSTEILQGARNRLLALDGVSESILEAAVAEVNRLRKDPYASAYFYWNRASAIKP